MPRQGRAEEEQSSQAEEAGQVPTLEWTYPDDRNEINVKTVHVYTDSDWAGCIRTRKSTSGGMITLGRVSLKHWSSTQSTIALSSGEAKFVAMVKAVTEGIAIQTLAVELGWSLNLVVHVDSSTAKAIASRSGIGKVRHLEVKTLWVQAALKDGRFALWKVPGRENPANVLTKSLGLKDFEGDLERVGA